MEEIYLDNAATTKPLNELKALYESYSEHGWHNPSSLYGSGVAAQKRLNECAETLLAALNSTGFSCFFTSGGTEGANTVILKGVRLHKNANFVCGGYEHPCVEECFLQLKGMGYEVRFVAPDKTGKISTDDVLAVADGNTALVSVMHVNNETGAVNDIADMSRRLKARYSDILFHSDGVQAFLRVGADLSNVDYYTVSAHKVHALKGVGAVFYKPNTPLKPYLLGGGQEKGLRSGTQNTFGIEGFALAAERFNRNKDEYRDKLIEIKNTFTDALLQHSKAALISPQSQKDAAPHIVCATFEGIAGETLMHMAEQNGVYFSTGSACSSKKGKSRAAKALGIGNDVAGGIIRISFSPFNTKAQAQTAAKVIIKAADALHKIKR